MPSFMSYFFAALRAGTHKFAISALPPKADIEATKSDVRFLP